MTDKEHEESSRCDVVRAAFAEAFKVAIANNVRVFLLNDKGFHAIEGEKKIWMEAQ